MAQLGQNMPVQTGGARGGPGNRTPAALEDVVKKEMSKCSWCREELELLLKYKDVVKRAVLNAIMKTRSCVLRYEYIYDEIYSLIDEDVAWSVENAFYTVLASDALRIDDVVVYKIYVDEDESTNDIVIALIGELLTEKQIEMLREIAELLATKKYDRFGEEEEEFYDATPLGAYERVEVYTTLHNLVCSWTNCRNVIEELEREEDKT
jgi:hypothetical protein